MDNLGKKLADKIGFVVQGGTVNVGQINIGGELSRQEYRNRQALLTKVKTFWVQGVLEKSLHEQVLITLGLEDRPEAIASPWNLDLATTAQPRQPLPEGTSIVSVFDQIGAGRSLLILGEPGSGKTITLLQLARDLIDRAEQDVSQLMPVVLNLSSWAGIKQSIAEWVVDELNSKYQVPRAIGKQWVKKQELLLLLDGLDEIRDDEKRNFCVSSINSFQQEQATEIVICCRSEDYKKIINRLHLQGCVYLNRLTPDQIQAYLERLSANLTQFKKLLNQDTALQELARSPLMLNIMVLSYKDKAEDIPQTTNIQERYQQIFDTYIDRMASYRVAHSQYSKREVVLWLSWLANKRIAGSQTVFSIDQMQPIWLDSSQERWHYHLYSKLGTGLVLTFILLSMLIASQYSSTEIIGALALRFFFLSGAIMFLVNYIQANRVVNDFIDALLISTSFVFLWAGISSSTLLALFLSVLFFILAIRNSPSQNEIQFPENVLFQFQKNRKKLKLFILGGLIVGTMVGLAVGFTAQDSLSGFLMGVSTSLGGFMLFTLGVGLSGNLIHSEVKIAKNRPNEKIIQTLYNIGISFLFLGITSSLTTLFLVGPAIFAAITPGEVIFDVLRYQLNPNPNLLAVFERVNTPYAKEFLAIVNQPFEIIFLQVVLRLGQVILPVAIGIFLGCGFLGGLIYGGITSIQHFVLRLILFSNHRIPWNYARFLDWASDRLFLQKVGGGYIFVHRLLMEHFAQMKVGDR